MTHQPFIQHLLNSYTIHLKLSKKTIMGKRVVQLKCKKLIYVSLSMSVSSVNWLLLNFRQKLNKFNAHHNLCNSWVRAGYNKINMSCVNLVSRPHCLVTRHPQTNQNIMGWNITGISWLHFWVKVFNLIVIFYRVGEWRYLFVYFMYTNKYILFVSIKRVGEWR